MSPAFVFALLAASLSAADGPRVAAGGAVRGAYLEARTADLYGGPCTGASSGDGRQAILAWQVADGSWGGVALAGLSVVVVVTADQALTGAATAPARARSLILVDAAAAPEQRRALEELARRSAASVLGEVVAVEPAPIQLAVDPARSLARLRVGQLAELRTRPFNRLDPLCGDETLSAPPLAGGVSAGPAVALEHAYRGAALGGPWRAANHRGAFVGTFGL